MVKLFVFSTTGYFSEFPLFLYIQLVSGVPVPQPSNRSAGAHIHPSVLPTQQYGATGRPEPSQPQIRVYNMYIHVCILPVTSVIDSVSSTSMLFF